MRVLVTGGCGFIGHHLVRRLQKDCHNIVVVDQMSGIGSMDRATAFSQKEEDEGLDGFELNECPICEYAHSDEHLPLEKRADRKFDLIFHLAAVSRTVPAIEDPYNCFFSNAIETVDVLELARVYGCPRVVVSSSNVVYAADTPYKASKLMMEEACKAYHETYGVSVVCLRYSNVYGPGFAKGDLACLAAMRDSLVDRGWLEITGDGEQTRDFTHVSDIVEGNLLAAKSDFSGTVDLCTGVNVSMNRAAAMLKSVHGGSTPQLKDWDTYKSMQATDWYRHVGDRRGDCKHIIQDPGPAKEILGWEAGVRFEDGVKDVWRY